MKQCWSIIIIRAGRQDGAPFVHSQPDASAAHERPNEEGALIGWLHARAAIVCWLQITGAQ